MNDFEIDPLLTVISIFTGLGFLAAMRSYQSDNQPATSTDPTALAEKDAEKATTLVKPLNQQPMQRSDQQPDDSGNKDRVNSSDAATSNPSNLKVKENTSPIQTTDEFLNDISDRSLNELPAEPKSVVAKETTEDIELVEIPVAASIDQPEPEEITEGLSNLTVTRDINLLQNNSLLMQLITQWIGENWLTQPQELKQLELLMQNTQFCSEWWQVKRTIKQSLAHTIHQQTGIEVNIHSLFDVHAIPISVQQRQLLNLLHVLTLYVRLKINATTDTVQHFTHRSVPRTCIFAGQVRSDDPIAASIAQLMQAVAETINNDPEVQGKLQVIVLIANYSAREQFQLMRQLRAAADLAQYIPLARQTLAHRTPLLFALNGAILLGSRHSSNLELQHLLGAKHCFLFGKTEIEVSNLQNQGYDPLSEYSSNLELQQVIEPIASGYFSYGDIHTFQDLGNWLLSQDLALVLADYSSYMDCQEQVSRSYQDQKHWTRLSILTTARAGQFLSNLAL